MDEDVKKLKEEKCNKLIEIIKHGGDLSAQKAQERTCERCGFTGPEQKFHKAGKSGFVNVCLSCVSKVRVHNRKMREDGKKILGYSDVILNFSEYLEFLETLQADAKRNFRTLENEILWRLVNG